MGALSNSCAEPINLGKATCTVSGSSFLFSCYLVTTALRAFSYWKNGKGIYHPACILARPAQSCVLTVPYI